MADPITSQQQEVTAGTSTTVTTVVSTDSQDQEVPTLHLKLKKPKTDRKVQWTTETVDNEEMNKKKSKCCCIYKKPREFGESSSSDEDSDDECDHCKGHVEKKKHKHDDSNPMGASSTVNDATTVVVTETDTVPPVPSANGNFDHFNKDPESSSSPPLT